MSHFQGSFATFSTGKIGKVGANAFAGGLNGVTDGVTVGHLIRQYETAIYFEASQHLSTSFLLTSSHMSFDPRSSLSKRNIHISVSYNVFVRKCISA